MLTDSQIVPDTQAYEAYQKRVRDYAAEVARQEPVLRAISNARLILFLVGAASAVLAYRGSPIAVTVFLLAVAVFFVLVRKHDRLLRIHNRTVALLDINRSSVARLEHRWTDFEADGAEFRDPEHRYIVDLDIFGPDSLFQWINVTNTHAGRERLRTWLTEPLSTTEEIHTQQEAVRQLGDNLDWRQGFQADGMASGRRYQDPTAFLNWAEDERPMFSRMQRVVYRVLPAVTVALVLVATQAPSIVWMAITMVLVQTGLFIVRYTKNNRLGADVREQGSAMQDYAGMLRAMEENPFSSTRLTEFRERLHQDGSRASEALEQLNTMTKRLEVQHHPLPHFLLNILFLWDIQYLRRTESWKVKWGKQLRPWLADLGAAEGLASLAIIAHDHPDWTFPEVVEGEPRVEAEGIGHPLLPDDRRVTNSVPLEGPGSVLVITGSNMSGKSTFLRTIGINLVLAYAGAPVCATRFRCTLVDVYTSMRNVDNLEKSISSFYAELLRMKMIVDAAGKDRPMLFLLDEIFRGTNSIDRYAGAVTVLKKLSDKGAMGLVSTHDLELGELADESDRFHAYHFEEHYVDDEIRFDYKLRTGISTTRNAMQLMKMVGIVDA